jgi:hypothetical protein
MSDSQRFLTQRKNFSWCRTMAALRPTTQERHFVRVALMTGGLPLFAFADDGVDCAIIHAERTRYLRFVPQIMVRLHHVPFSDLLPSRPLSR